MAKFDLGDFAKTMQAVPNSGTAGQEQIEYLPLAELHEDERNFYAVSGVEELAANIQLCGLMDPLRVRKAEDGYTIVSGHRRFAALKLLAAEDSKFEEVACIIETGDIPEQLQELRLIFANSATRDMSSADKAKQAERVEVLLYELKEQGMEFPGRMRDRVAEACRISRSKLGRLQNIQRNLAPCYKPLWEAGDLPEDTADALASMPEEVQERIKRVFPKKTPRGGAVRNIAGKIKSGRDYCATDLSCPDGAACTNQDKFFRHDLSCNSWETCGGKECCVKCTRGGAHDPAAGSYNAVCSEMCPKAKAIYEKAKEKSKAKAEREKVDSHTKAVQQGMADARRLVRAADAAGLSDKDTVPGYSVGIRIGTLRSIMQGEIPKGMSDYQLVEFIPYRTETLRKMAETLHCSADYLLGLADEPRATVSSAMPGQTTVGCWMPGSTTPDHPCECYVMLDVSEMNMKEPAHRSKAYWAGEAFRLKPSAYAEKITPFPVLSWLEIPEWKGGNGDA
jgi:ParB family transcriptional regulator, chromosome partitioning protein